MSSPTISSGSTEFNDPIQENLPIFVFQEYQTVQTWKSWLQKAIAQHKSLLQLLTDPKNPHLKDPSNEITDDCSDEITPNQDAQNLTVTSLMAAMDHTRSILENIFQMLPKKWIASRIAFPSIQALLYVLWKIIVGFDWLLNASSSVKIPVQLEDKLRLKLAILREHWQSSICILIIQIGRKQKAQNNADLNTKTSPYMHFTWVDQSVISKDDHRPPDHLLGSNWFLGIVHPTSSDSTGSSENKIELLKQPRLPVEAKEMMKKWITDNRHHPYPSQAVKNHFMNTTGLSMPQIEDWFCNARRRTPGLSLRKRSS